MFNLLFHRIFEQNKCIVRSMGEWGTHLIWASDLIITVHIYFMYFCEMFHVRHIPMDVHTDGHVPSHIIKPSPTSQKNEK